MQTLECCNLVIEPYMENLLWLGFKVQTCGAIDIKHRLLHKKKKNDSFMITFGDVHLLYSKSLMAEIFSDVQFLKLTWTCKKFLWCARHEML